MWVWLILVLPYNKKCGSSLFSFNPIKMIQTVGIEIHDRYQKRKRKKLDNIERGNNQVLVNGDVKSCVVRVGQYFT